MTKTKGCIASVYHLTDDHTPDFYIVKKCPHTRVTTILENEVEEWHAITPVVIDAPVGLGKSTFVREVLYPRARSHGKNIVVVNNRSALTAQQKKDFLKQVQSEYLKILSEKGIAEQKIFDDIAIVTYQGLVSFLNDPANKEWINQVEYVIADELHFFASDASFNYNCDLILRTLIRTFSKAVRVYMTATPWDMLYPLSKAEETFYSNISEGHFCIANHVFRPPRRGILYHFERDFSDYSLRFFEKTEEIIEKILADKKEKWLIFIDRKDRLLDISSGLSDKPNYLDADQKETPIFEKLVQEERFDGQVLISTSVIDCGINIFDENLKNIVIFSDDRTALMQMAGRKRLRDGDTITLWIHTPSEKALTKQKNRYNVFLDFEEEYTNRLEQLELAPKRPYQAFHDLIIKIWNHPCIELRNLFQVTGNRVHKNELAFFKMHRKVDFYNNILSGKTTFQREVEDWFGKPHTDCNTALNALDLFYENHFKQFLDSKEQDALRELVILAYKETGKTQARTDRNDTIGAIALNNLLVEINSQYRVERINSQFWGLFKNN